MNVKTTIFDNGFVRIEAIESDDSLRLFLTRAQNGEFEFPAFIFAISPDEADAISDALLTWSIKHDPDHGRGD